MKRVLIGIAAIIVVFAGYLVYRASIIPAPAEIVAAPPPATVDSMDVARRVSAALKFQTVSYGEGVKEEEKNAALEEMRTWMERIYPNFHDAAGPEAFGKSLLFTWIGKNPNLLPVLIMAHMDVVPIEPGTEKDWAHAPFSGDIAEGFVWGRGAMDDKASLIAILDAAERLAVLGFQPERTTMFAFGEDEEVGGAKGNAVIAKALATRGIRLAWVLDEGMPILREPYPGVRKPVALLGVGEKGYLSLDIVAHGEGGHSSRPTRDMALPRLASAITNVTNRPFVSDLDDIQRSYLDVLTPIVPFGDRIALANLWLTKPFVVRKMASQPEIAALLHTTISPTILEAGVKDNVIPSSAKAVINFRLHPRDTMASVTEHVRVAINDPKVDITRRTETQTEASKIVAQNDPAYVYVADKIRASFAVPVAPQLLTGATDSVHYLPIAGAVLRFWPIPLDTPDLPRIHGTNERIAVADLGPMVAFYMRVIQDLR